MADTPLLQLSRASFPVVQTWLHCRGAAIEAALTYPVLEDQKADFVELLAAEGHQISAFIGTYPTAEKLSIDPSLAHLIHECQVPQSTLHILSSVSDSPWANEEKAHPSYASQVPLPITQQWWRLFHEAARTQALFPPTPSMESPNTEDRIQRLQHAHESLREHLSFVNALWDCGVAVVEWDTEDPSSSRPNRDVILRLGGRLNIGFNVFDIFLNMGQGSHNAIADVIKQAQRCL
ncbi:hypothetical protein HYDPIDRAFT_31833 [Hydnomerulius pinastri MD-312]|uniref:Uncharacterized protein n=1 Tax=Hydnomerulius pinastri MD-312 TaxID=994086 RepID=A0A0C9WB78_9AGAM|nr:hypothetical protein HYDPIDRAFT_31833 [Hydnomerulius pinastri MD-312]